MVARAIGAAKKAAAPKILKAMKAVKAKAVKAKEAHPAGMFPSRCPCDGCGGCDAMRQRYTCQRNSTKGQKQVKGVRSRALRGAPVALIHAGGRFAGGVGVAVVEVCPESLKVLRAHEEEPEAVGESVREHQRLVAVLCAEEAHRGDYRHAGSLSEKTLRITAARSARECCAPNHSLEVMMYATTSQSPRLSLRMVNAMREWKAVTTTRRAEML